MVKMKHVEKTLGGKITVHMNVQISPFDNPGCSLLAACFVHGEGEFQI